MSSSKLNSDRPINDPQNDLLGYAPLAKSIANGISHMCTNDGLVMAITGDWGMGKTTTLNFVKYYLKKDLSNIQIIDFNPWWFSGHEDLAQKLLKSIAQNCNSESEKELKLTSALIDLARATLSNSTELKNNKMGLEVGLEGLHDIKTIRASSSADIPVLKEEIKDLLLETGKRFLVIIDDLDRLPTSDLRELFRVIKAICDLPNVVYLLAFDPKIVATALDKKYANKGTEYLEKIVQVTFTIPQPTPERVSSIFAGCLSSLFTAQKTQEFRNSRHSRLYSLGLRHLLVSPRQAIRLANTLCITVPSVEGEVSLPDFISIEAIRLLLPELYDLIRRNKDKFAGVGSHHAKNSNFNTLKQFHEIWVEEYGKKYPWLRSFLIELFPKLDYALNATGYDPNYLASWRKDLRVCHPDIFDTYFRFSNPTETLSAKDLKRFLSQLSSPNLVSLLKERTESESLDEKKWLWELVDRLSDYTDSDISETEAESLFSALLDSWVTYKHAEGEGSKNPLLPDNSYLLSNLLLGLLYKISKRNQTNIILESLNKPFPIEYMSRLIRDVVDPRSRGKQKLNSTQPMSFSDDDSRKIIEAFCKNTIDLLTKKSISKPEELCRILSCLIQWSPHHVSRAVEVLKETVQGCVALISYGVQESTNYETNGISSRYDVSLTKIATLTDPKELLPLAELAKNSPELSKRSQAIAGSFLEQLATEPGKKNLDIRIERVELEEF